MANSVSSTIQSKHMKRGRIVYEMCIVHLFIICSNTDQPSILPTKEYRTPFQECCGMSCEPVK